MGAARRVLPLAAFAALLGCRSAAAPGFADARTGVSAQAPAGWELERFPPTLDRLTETLAKLVVAQAGEPAEGGVRRLARFSSAPMDRLGDEDVVVSIAVVEVGTRAALREDVLLAAAVRTFPGRASLEGPPRPLALGGVPGTGAEARFPLKRGEVRQQAFLGRRGSLMLVLGAASKTRGGLARAEPVLGSLKFAR